MFQNKKKSPFSDSLSGGFYQVLKVIVRILHNVFQKIKAEWILPNPFYEAELSLIPKLRYYIKENYKPTLLLTQKLLTKF